MTQEPLRDRLLARLSRHEGRTVRMLRRSMHKMPSQAVFDELGVLLAQGVVRTVRDGQRMLYLLREESHHERESA